LLQNTICGIITFKVYIVWWKSGKVLWLKKESQPTCQVVPRFRFSNIHSGEDLLEKLREKQNKKQRILKCQKEICFPRPINKFVPSMKQKKSKGFVGIFIYGSSSP
jgi:hypothetical protein